MHRPLALVGEWLETGYDESGVRFRGWVFRDPRRHSSVAYDSRRVLGAGALVIRVAGVSYRREALQQEVFRPGEAAELAPEPSNPHDPNAVAIWDAGHRHQVGYVPKELAPEIAARLRGGDQIRALCLAEFVDRSGSRCGLRILIAPPSFTLNLPPRGR